MFPYTVRLQFVVEGGGCAVLILKYKYLDDLDVFLFLFVMAMNSALSNNH